MPPVPPVKAKVAICGGAYFVLVFAAGFVLGTLRVLLLEPRIGVRAAELLEMPVMLLVIFLAARYLVARMPPAATRAPYLAAGGIGLALLLLFEVVLVLGLRGMSLGEYFASRDPLAFAAYLASLLIFAIMPALVSTPGRRPRG